MASQQVLFAETIAGMKKAFKRRAYESDSDSEIESYGNRGHKLKRRARFANQGQLVPSEGPSAYKETVDYAGLRRSIIHRNPRLVDEDGYEIDTDDDDDRIEDAINSAAELNPYSNIRLENVLAPLTASTDLPTHPTLSKPFTSPNLTNLVAQSSAMVRRENSSLWRVRHLFTSLCGDHVWAPCETMLGADDSKLYTEDHVAMHLLSLSQGAANHSPGARGTGRTAEQPALTAAPGAVEDADVSMAEAETGASEREDKLSGGEPQSESKDLPGEDSTSGTKEDSKPPQGPAESDHAMTNGNTDYTAGPNEAARGGHQVNGEENGAAGNLDSSNAPDVASKSFVHPIFLPPAGARPSRDLGVPAEEAEDLRRMLNAFVQKQEEVARGSQRLYDGLNKAERLRKDVLHWSKAEAHCGPNRDMSDGEDWYDKEEWGLTEDLKKGQDDEEEDTTTTAKKTRARR